MRLKNFYLPENIDEALKRRKEEIIKKTGNVKYAEADIVRDALRQFLGVR